MQTTSQTQFSFAGAVWLKLAVLYLLLGIGLGIAMGTNEDFTLRPVHAHLNLLGWATLALAGLIYSVFPQAGASRLARLHFWLSNLSLPVMMVALTFLLLGKQEAQPWLAVSSLVVALGALAFAANLFLNLKER